MNCLECGKHIYDSGLNPWTEGDVCFCGVTTSKVEDVVNPLRELTDEEITEVYGKYFDAENCDWYHLECIRAILKLASMK
jgi:hypothetical protein